VWNYPSAPDLAAWQVALLDLLFDQALRYAKSLSRLLKVEGKLWRRLVIGFCQV